jgi:catalase
MGFTSFPERFTTEDKVRGNPELFAEHYGQARLFYQSQTPVEQAHIANAFRFELTRVQTPAVRERILALLANIDAGLVAKVAEGLGMDVPAPLPRAFEDAGAELSAVAGAVAAEPSGRDRHPHPPRRDPGGAASTAQVRSLYESCSKTAPCRAWSAICWARSSRAGNGDALDVEITLEAGPSVMYDAMIVPDGDNAADGAGRNAHAIDFVREQYRHCKPILVLGAGANLLAKAMIPTALPDGSADPALLIDGSGGCLQDALASHRSFARETDPPMV